MKLKQLGYLLKEGFRGVFAHGFRSFASVTVIAACLIIMGSFALVAVNVNAFIGDLEEDSQVLAFVDDALSEDEARSLEGAIRSLNNVRKVEFVNREKATADFKASMEDSSVFDSLEGNVLRHRYVIYLNDITLMSSTKEAVENISGIAHVRADISIAQGFITIRNVFSVIAAVLIVILLIVSLFMMSNTIKLATFTRREEIAIMKMVGASNSFIRFPFEVEGLILGLLGAGIGFLLEWGVYNLISSRISQTALGSLTGRVISALPFSVLMTPLLVVYLAIGIIIGTFGGAMAIRNYLKV